MGHWKRITTAGAVALAALGAKADAGEGVGDRAEPCPAGEKQCAGPAAYAANEAADDCTKSDDAQPGAAAERAMASSTGELGRAAGARADNRAFAAASTDVNNSIEPSQRVLTPTADIPPTQIAAVGARMSISRANAVRSLVVDGPALEHAGHSAVPRNLEEL